MPEVTESPSAARPPRLRFLDGLRGVAAVVIVLHHLCCYGPLESAAAEFELDLWGCKLSARPIIAALWEHGRLAVQVFFVVSGFTAAYVLPKGPLSIREVGRLVLLRYLRLALPCAAAIGLHFLVQGLVGSKNLFPPLVDPFTVDELVVHFLFLQDVLHYEPMFVAYWYLAIEVQFALLLLSLTALVRWWNGPKNDVAADHQLLMILAGLSIVSVVYWNQHDRYDQWVIYFLCSYFVGVLVAFIVRERCSVVHFFGYAAVVFFAVGWPEPRVRPLVAIAVGGLILKASRGDGLQTWLSARPFRFLGRISYSLFLTHVPISRLVLSLGFLSTGIDPTAAIGWMILALVASILFAWLFAETIERRLLKLVTPAPTPEHAK